jgi:hypothetical protein
MGQKIHTDGFFKNYPDDLTFNSSLSRSYKKRVNYEKKNVQLEINMQRFDFFYLSVKFWFLLYEQCTSKEAINIDGSISADRSSLCINGS